MVLFRSPQKAVKLEKQNLRTTLTRAIKKQGKTIVFIDEAHMMNGAGAGGGNSSNDLANMLKPALGKGDIKVVASTTWDEYRKFFEKDRALMRRFQRVSVDEPDKQTSNDILKGIKKYYEEFHKATITDEAIKAAVKLSIKYQTDKKLPDKAIDLIDLACSRFNLQDQQTDPALRETRRSSLPSRSPGKKCGLNCLSNLQQRMVCRNGHPSLLLSQASKTVGHAF